MSKPFNFNINPVHLDPQNEGTSFTFTNPVSPYQSNNKAFQSPQNEGNSFTFANPKQSGFQYILGIPSRFASSADGQGMVETVSRVVSRTIHETLGTNDSAQLFPLRALDGQGLLDKASRVVSRTIHETLGFSDIDSIFKPQTASEGQGMVDSATRIVQRTANEFLGGTETASEAKRITSYCTVNIRGNARVTLPFTVTMGLKTRVTNKYTVKINGNGTNINGTGAPTYLVAATSATGVDYLGNSNPFNPVVVVDGTAIYGSAPPNVSTSGIYIDIPNTGTNRIGSGALNWGDLFNFGMSLDYSGGTFNITSIPFFGNRGDTLNVFGLTGTLTDAGYKISNSAKGYTSAGIFGLPILNKQFELIQQSTQLLKFLNTAQVIPSSNGTASPAGITVQSAAQEVASICGINLNWMAQDLPLQNFAYEPSMNGNSALNSLAQRVGANLRWYGNNNYYVAYPPTTVGEFIIPSAKLVSAVGLDGASHLDLETGIGGAVNINSYGTPVASLQTYLPPGFAIAGAGSFTLPAIPFNNGFTSPIIPVSGPIIKLLTSSDPPLIYNLPSQFTDVLVQCLIPPSYVPSGQYVTTDPGVWDEFVDPGNGQNFDPTNGKDGFGTSDYIFQVYEGGAYVKKIKIDYNVFPTHPAVQAGQFTLQIGALVNSLPFPLQPLNPNFIPSYVQSFKGTINCVFFGVMPLPGMLVSTTVDNLTVSGVIERVTYTSPGFLQLDVAQYTLIDWLIPYLSQAVQN